MVAREGVAVAGTPMRSKAKRRSSRPMMKREGAAMRWLRTSGKDSPIHSRPGAVERFSKGTTRRRRPTRWFAASCAMAQETASRRRVRRLVGQFIEQLVRKLVRQEGIYSSGIIDLRDNCAILRCGRMSAKSEKVCHLGVGNGVSVGFVAYGSGSSIPSPVLQHHMKW